MKRALAIAVIAVAWSSALFVHQRTVTSWHPQRSLPGAIYTAGFVTAHPSWEDPAAVLVALGGLAVAFGIGFNNKHTNGGN